MNCLSCGNPIPEEAKFCPVCGSPVPAEHAEAQEAAPVSEEPSSAQEAPSAGSWYQTAQQQETPNAAPVFVSAKSSIGGIFDFYRKALAILAAKPIKLWGISLLYLVVVSLISSLGAFVPILSVPIVLLVGLGFTGVLLTGYHGGEVCSEQLFRSFRKDEIVRNAAGMCWMELWTMIWGFVPVMNIIKYYSYCFTPYILLTDKEIPATEALKKSMRMTDGYKGKLFGADILLVLGFMLAMIVLSLFAQIPYIGWIFIILLIAVYIGFLLFFPLFLGLVHTAFFDEISAAFKE